jgi:hypothetical protein
VRLIRRGTAPFEQAGGGAMRLEMRGVDHEPVRLVCMSGQLGGDAVEDLMRLHRMKRL